jgi:hypothetical protein
LQSLKEAPIEIFPTLNKIGNGHLNVHLKNETGQIIKLKRFGPFFLAIRITVPNANQGMNGRVNDDRLGSGVNFRVSGETDMSPSTAYSSTSVHDCKGVNFSTIFKIDTPSVASHASTSVKENENSVCVSVEYECEQGDKLTG